MVLGGFLLPQWSVLSATTPKYPFQLILSSPFSSLVHHSLQLSSSHLLFTHTHFLLHHSAYFSLYSQFTLLSVSAVPLLTSPFPLSLAVSLFISVSLTPRLLLIKSWGEGNTSCQTLCTSVWPTKSICAFTAENNWSKKIHKSAKIKCSFPRSKHILPVGSLNRVKELYVETPHFTTLRWLHIRI